MTVPGGWRRTLVLVAATTMSIGVTGSVSDQGSGGVRQGIAVEDPPALRAPLPPAQPLTGWEAHRTLIIGSVGVVVIETLLIVWLVDEHRRRRRAEAEIKQRLQEAREQLVTITHLDRRAAMGEVTSAITHQLNQPLEAILHNAEAGELMLESGEVSREDMHRIFADIRRIDLRAAKIIGRLRSLLGKRDFETRLLCVNDLATETAALVAPVATSNGIRIDLDLSMSPVPVNGDSIHLQQVLLNVLLNGIESMGATPREQRRLVLRTTRVKDHVEVSVTDFGHGIRADAVARVFEPFYTTKDQGMGIGLSIGRTIIEAHGGRIAARNNDNEAGATVWFTVPAYGSPAAEPAVISGNMAGTLTFELAAPHTAIRELPELRTAPTVRSA